MLDAYIRQYGRRLFGLCLHLCAHRQDAEDLYQECWLKVMTHLDRYDPQREFEPWLTTICVNLYRSRLRRLARSPIFDGFSTEEEKTRTFQNVPAPEQEDHREVHEAVDRLPEKLRLAVILYYFEDMDVESTAKVLKVPAGTVKSRLNRARKLLKEVLSDEEGAL